MYVRVFSYYVCVTVYRQMNDEELNNIRSEIFTCTVIAASLYSKNGILTLQKQKKDKEGGIMQEHVHNVFG